jgi:hypothetical protein
VIKSYAVWDIPGPSRCGSVVRALLSDWQLSGVLTAGSAYQPGAAQANGARASQPTRRTAGTTITYTYQNAGTNVNLTGSPDYAAKIVSSAIRVGLSTHQYAQVQYEGGHRTDLRQRRPRIGPQHLGGCPDHTWTCRLPGTFGSAATATSSSARRVQRVQRRHLQRPQPQRDSTAARRI